jgi:Ca2+:H+ antiporter
MTERRLHESARRALDRAQAEAARLGHEVVGSEHVLLGVLLTSPLADEVLQGLGIDGAQVRQRLESGPKKVRARGEESPDGTLPLTSHARRLLDSGRGEDEVSDVSLLLAAVTDQRGALGKVLAERGIESANARAEIRRRAGLPVDEPAPPVADVLPEAPAKREKARQPQREVTVREKAPPVQREKKPRDGREAREPREPRDPRGARAGEVRARREPDPEERPAELVPSLGKLAPKPKPPLWRTILLPAVPVSIALGYFHASPVLVFATACLAVLPLAGLMGEATEHIAARTGPTIGGLLNATFGNAAELIIAIMGLRAAAEFLTTDPAKVLTYVGVVKASITGSIIGNLLLILGLAFVAGGLKRPVLRFNRTTTGMSAGMLFLSVVSLVLPALYHNLHRADVTLGADERTISLEMGVVLLLTYAASLLFTLRTHSSLLGGEPHPVEGPTWSMGKAGVVLALATAGVAIESELLVHAIGEVSSTLGLSAMFLGLIVVPIIGNAAEHGAAVIFARKGQMDLSLQIALGSSTQVALLVAPILVFVGVAMGVPMDLVFSPFEVLVLALATVTAAVLTLDGESHWFEGVQLLALYVMVGIAAFFM